ncbi:MAG: MBL fold metallo-hydrolase [Proteobacteria bacterium]|nr:MBL fold metallo-hydrolase [Pseudomonadota bacterium]
MAFWLRFWGVRGSIACPSPRHMAFGGNTSCVEVRAGDELLVLDAGTGIRELGRSFLRQDVRRARLLLSHTHWDHINGFPFFTPAYRRDRSLRILAGHLSDRGGVRQILADQMTTPMFPVPFDNLRADLDFEDFRAGDSFALGSSLRIRTAPLNHPDGATGYRIEHAGKALCYVTDTEHNADRQDQNVLGLIEGADLVIYDSTYTDEEYPRHRTWGHSTWQEGVRLCRSANVKHLAIFHHDPDHEDAFMHQVEADARRLWDGAWVAREGARIELA